MDVGLRSVALFRRIFIEPCILEKKVKNLKCAQNLQSRSNLNKTEVLFY